MEFKDAKCLVGPSKCAAFNRALHIFSQAQLFQNTISKSVHHFGTTPRVLKGEGNKSQLLTGVSNAPKPLFGLKYDTHIVVATN